MLKQIISVLVICCSLTPFLVKSQNVSSIIIPKPNKIESGEGFFKLKNNTTISYTADSVSNVAKLLQTNIGFKKNNLKKTTNVADKNTISYQIVNGFASEAYRLEITDQQITCKASTLAGLFYATQSLIQLVENSETLQASIIEDQPAYTWRGFMLDESRHFRGKETVKQYLDIMARLKLNRFHWHLTDEQGWRIEIKKYPKLTTIGAVGNWSDRNAPAQYYTQEEIKEVVAYAAERHIMVIPEIDMPGHATAATKAYPEISGGGDGRWAGFTFNPAKEETYEFLNNVLTEVAALFPAPYIHIGADEVHFGNQSWFTDPVIQNFIKKNYLASEVGIEHYFVRRICEMINEKGKKMIGWDEIINTGVTPQKAIVMWWRHDKKNELSLALNKGFQVIMTPRVPCYFDFVQDDSHKIGRRWDGNFGTLEKVYAFPQNLSNITKSKENQILGLQANIWTERIADKKRLDFMVFPRLLAISEGAWTSSENKNYDNFRERIRLFIPYLEKQGINYFNVFDPSKSPEPYGPDKEDVIAEG